MNTRLKAAGHARRLGALALCAALGLTAGCLGPREMIGPKTFVIRPEVSIAKTEKTLSATLGVRRLPVPSPTHSLPVDISPMWATPSTWPVPTRC
jgi:hypothetical protein